MNWHTDSLEAKLKMGFGLCLLVQLIFCGFLFWYFPLWHSALIAMLLLGLFAFVFKRLSVQILVAFRRASVQLEALQQQDYSLVAKPVFSQGYVAEFHRQLNELGDVLQEHKSRYDQQQFLVYRLIDQLNTPILVFNQRLQLSYANAAFTTLFGQPWQSLRHASPTLLGLVAEPEWRFDDINKAHQWQIRTSRFVEQGINHQLLVFINIQSALRESQLAAWQQLIRVLSHEIRNSLTPVAALTENLQTKIQSERESQALGLIAERCQHLQDFVSRYAELHKPLSVQLQWVDGHILCQRLMGLFPTANIHVRGLPIKLWSDPVLLQQVLINLIKNSLEASSPEALIELVFSQGEGYEIRIVDRGHGIANSENLFVPFYTTKAQGQGIGLSISRHIIEQMGGQLSLRNNSQGGGAHALIYLLGTS